MAQVEAATDELDAWGDGAKRGRGRRSRWTVGGASGGREERLLTRAQGKRSSRAKPFTETPSAGADSEDEEKTRIARKRRSKRWGEVEGSTM
jgi:hypothetical protein